MYRRGDPRWNRTIQNIADNIEHANESTQEHLWTFTHDYVNPCLSSFTQCVNTCTAPCFPSLDDRRRIQRTRGRGRAEQSFDFYDDWDEDESEGLLGWGNDNLDRFLGSSSNYGTVAQPGRQRNMTYGTRNRDARFNTGRRKSAVQLHDGGPDPTIIPSSSYFGFLGRLPFKFGGKVLRYKPSAADLTEHPGQSRRSLEEGQPLIDESDEEPGQRAEVKGHRRQRSHTSASGNTTDSLSSRGDIFPSEDELDDAVPIDDEFTMALERRTTSQWHDDTSSGKTRLAKNKRPSGSRVSSHTASSRNTQRSNDDGQAKRSASELMKEVPSLSDLKQEEERLRLSEEAEIERRRQEAQRLALQRGLASEHHHQQHLTVHRSPSPASVRSRSRSPRLSPLSHTPAQSIHHLQTLVSPIAPSPSSATGDAVPFPSFEEPQTAPDSSSFHVDESDFSSLAPTPNRPLSLRDEPREVSREEAGFVPARLPHFDTVPD